MMTGFRGTFVISWAQTELDGLARPELSALSVGATWQWHGEATRVDGPGSILVLDQSQEAAELRLRAARVVQRLVNVALEKTEVERLPDPEIPLLDRGFALTDGIRSFTATIVECPGHAPLLVFLNEVPPEGVDLWITHVTDQMLHANRSGDQTPHVICFTPQTKLATPDGPRRVAELSEDDLILTKDDGPQPIRWIGSRRITGARLFAMPELRPIRIAPEALGAGVPDEDLLVSPEHRILLQGGLAQHLFNEAEVLVAAKDMLNDSSIRRDRHVSEVTYVHILLDRHQIVFANGVESESFHPASMPRSSMNLEQQAALTHRLPGLSQDGSSYGAFARRMLTSAETAILRFKGFGDSIQH